MTKVCGGFLAGLLLIGCSGEDSSVTPINSTPTITFTTNRIAIPKAMDYDLSVSVSDADADDHLTVAWTITSGTLTARNAENTVMRWDTPSTVGTDTVTVTVNDGSVSASVEEVIKRGTITAETTTRTTYTKANSPYILAPNNSPPSVLVSGGTITTIEPGVEIYMDFEESFIDVLGTLQANGNEIEPILIRANDRSLMCGEGRGWWDGVQARSEDYFVGNLDLTHTEIRSGDYNVRLIGAAQANLQDCKIVCGRNAGVGMTGTGVLVINNCEISSTAQSGINVSSYSSIPAAVSITGCEIMFNNEGIHLDLPDLFETLLVNIQGNLIRDNWINGITLERASFARINYNYIGRNNWGNTSNIRLMPDYPGGADFDSLDATNNYWGGAYTNPGPIEDTITDSADNGSIDTKVIITPWLSSSPL
jgi:hypothetical protein